MIILILYLLVLQMYHTTAKLACHSRIKQLIHNYYTSIEKQVDIPSFKSLQVEQEKLQQLVSDMSAKLEGLTSSNDSLRNQVNTTYELIHSTESSLKFLFPQHHLLFLLLMS